MNNLHQDTSTTRSQAPNKTDRNHLGTWSDKILETNKDTPFLAKK